MSTRYSALTSLNKTFTCSQCNRNYNSMLIKFYNQLTEVNHTLPMRILIYCNLHNLLAIQCFGLQPLKISLQESLGRQWHCGSCSLTSLPPGRLCHRCQWQRSRCRDGTACRKFVSNPSKSEIHFLYFIKIN